MKRNFFGRLHRTLAGSRLAMTVVYKVRNQCARIIQNHLGPSIHSSVNGEALLIQRLADRLQVVFDIGANTGEWTELVLSHAPARMHLFECNPALAEALRVRFANQPDVQINIQAMGDRQEERVFYLSAESSELGSLHRETSTSPQGSRQETRVQVNTVDDYCKAQDIQQIDLLKIDTEGHDFPVLLGAQRMLSEQRVQVIQFEYGEGWRLAGATLTHCLAWLTEKGYHTFLLTPGGLKTCQLEVWGEFFGYSNFVACTRKFLESRPEGLIP